MISLILFFSCYAEEKYSKYIQRVILSRTVFGKMLYCFTQKQIFPADPRIYTENVRCNSCRMHILFERKQVFNVYCVTPFHVNKYCYMQRMSAGNCNPKRHRWHFKLDNNIENTLDKFQQFSSRATRRSIQISDKHSIVLDY